MTALPPQEWLWMGSAVAFCLLALYSLFLRLPSFNTIATSLWAIGQITKAGSALYFVMTNYNPLKMEIILSLILLSLVLEFIALTFIMRGEWHLKKSISSVLFIALLLIASAQNIEPPIDISLHMLYFSMASIFSLMCCIAVATSPTDALFSKIIVASSYALFSILSVTGFIIFEFHLTISLGDYNFIIFWASSLILVLSAIQGAAACIIIGSSATKERERRCELDVHTKLFNSYGFTKRASKIRKFCARLDKPVSILALKIHSFEAVERIDSPAAQDTLLRDVGLALKFCLRNKDVVGYIEKNLFLVLLPFSDINNAQKVCNRIHGFVKREVFFYHQEQKYSVSINFGITDIPNKEEFLEAAIQRSTAALDRSGKGQIVVEKS